MEQNGATYNNIFKVEERKKLLAYTLGEMRKARGLSQKEVAARIEVSQATYSAYERGRNEPPVEIIVRLSYVLDCPIDLLVQRDRLFRNASEAVKQAEDLRAQVAQLEEDLKKSPQENGEAAAMIEMMKKLSDALIETNRRADASLAINDPLG